LCTNSSLPRPRLETTASPEIQIRIEVGSKTFSLLTSPFNQVHSLKQQIEELSGVPVDCQLLRLDGKPLVMNKFLLGDYRIVDNSTIYVQVHPWNEEYVSINQSLLALHFSIIVFHQFITFLYLGREFLKPKYWLFLEYSLKRINIS